MLRGFGAENRNSNVNTVIFGGVEKSKQLFLTSADNIYRGFLRMSDPGSKIDLRNSSEFFANLAHRYSVDGEGATQVCELQFDVMEDSYVGYGSVCNPLVKASGQFKILKDQRAKEKGALKTELDRIEKQAPKSQSQKADKPMCHYIQSGTGVFLSYEFFDQKSCNLLDEAMKKEKASERRFVESAAKLREGLEKENKTKLERLGFSSALYEDYLHLRKSVPQTYRDSFEPSIDWMLDQSDPKTRNKNSLSQRFAVGKQLLEDMAKMWGTLDQTQMDPKTKDKLLRDAIMALREDSKYLTAPKFIQFRLILAVALSKLDLRK